MRNALFVSPASIIVADPRPLLTLAVAYALDALLVHRLPVVVPDMVLFEATRDISMPGAEAVANWIRANEPDLVCVARTVVFAEFEVLAQFNASTKTKGRCEQAASEVLSIELGKQGSGEVYSYVLLVEESMARTDNFLTPLPEHVAVMSIAKFLKTAAA